MSQPFYLPVQLFRETCLFSHVEDLVEEFADVWFHCSPKTFRLDKKYSRDEQQQRELHLQDFIQNLESESKKKNAEFENVDMQDRMFAHVRAFFQMALGFQQTQLDLILSLGFKESTKEFVQLARQFDARLKPADLFQACRNVWIMNGLQLLLGLKVRFTPAIFAYSLLYPYTDNYLDDATIAKQEKIEFNDRFAQRLAGFPAPPNNDHENIIFTLVEMIEKDFSRAHYPKVFESLLAIHQAQTKSVLLLGSENLSDEQVLRISLEKGGASVLADGYLVAGQLTKSQASFMFGYGAYLQLLDDLQDVHEDSLAGQRSLYTIEAKKAKLDSITNVTFDFGEKVLGSPTGFSGKAVKSYTRLMRTSIQLMLVEAAAFAPDLYTKTYMKKLEGFSPFRFSQLRVLKKRHAPYYVSMFGKLI